MPIKGSITSKPFRNEDLDQDDLLKKVEERIANLKRELGEKEKPFQRMGELLYGEGTSPTEAKIPMNDELAQHVGDSKNRDLLIRELLSRVSDLEERLPEFKGLDSWDVRITPLKSTATLAEVIKKLNTVIQRFQSRDRVR